MRPASGWTQGPEYTRLLQFAKTQESPHPPKMGSPSAALFPGPTAQGEVVIVLNL